MEQKNLILEKTKISIAKICKVIENETKSTQAKLTKKRLAFNHLSPEQKIVANKMIPQLEKKVEELKHLKGSPYFSSLEFDLHSNHTHYAIHIGKFGCSQGNIYSWTTPVASLRFEKPGNARYLCPGNILQTAMLHKKDQLMIVDQKLKFLATESIGNPRKLIYQEHFSNRKSGFMLPEIVAEMEKAQDQVIRAHHIGPFLITGPAGSGKTTLALHRVAYLIQSPDLNNLYEEDAIIVFVQDKGTKKYFSQLLPELGINNVIITTFDEWALKILGLPDIQYTDRMSTRTDIELDEYEFAKLSAIEKNSDIKLISNPFTLLRRTYSEVFNNSQKNLFDSQTREKTLDRIDLTILLAAYKNTKGFLGVTNDFWEEQTNGKYKKKHGLIPHKYSLAVIDEFQNYIPAQLRLIKSCIDKNTKSVVYVGDMAQQVKIGTIKDWKEINEDINNDRKAMLQKVYRNTKCILKYINTFGYEAEIPDDLKEGIPVKEISLTHDKVSDYIQNTLLNNDYVSAGVLINDIELSKELKLDLAHDKKIQIMTINEAQGVEFDIVFIINLQIFMEQKDKLYSNEKLAKEKTKINKDLAYVALTRAISELYMIEITDNKNNKS
ncbi:TPA: hypothetical protein DCG29_04065 [Candidatus Nomurabacteria bacterium]|nr:hypothetical protein [Candidatus Nomurabacteria bacterium]